MLVTPLEMHEALAQELRELRLEVTELKAQLPVWISQKEACKLSGHSRTWFFSERKAGRLSVAYKKLGARSLLYSRADCVALGRKNLILPPATLTQ